MDEKKKRIEWIDMARGYGILLVMIGHLVLGTQLARWIYTFHMPLFFFLSGYVFSDKRQFPDFVKSKCKSILVPYFSIGVCIILFEVIYYPLIGSSQLSAEYISHKFTDLFVQVRCWTLWYIACLFWLNIFFYVLVKVLRKIWLVGLVCILITIGGYEYYQHGGVGLFWNIDVCFIAITFFFAGYFAKNIMSGSRLQAALSGIKNKKLVYIIIFIAMLAGNIFFGRLSYKLSGLYTDMYYGTYGQPVIAFLSAFCGIFAVTAISSVFCAKPLMYMGENSMLYYIIHQSIIMPLSETVFGFFGFTCAQAGTAAYWYFKGAQLLFLIITLTLISILFNRTKLRVLLGKW